MPAVRSPCHAVDITSTSGSMVFWRSIPESSSGMGMSVVDASGTRTYSLWPPCTRPSCCQVRGAQPNSDHELHDEGSCS